MSTQLEFYCGELTKIASSKGIPNLPGKSMHYIDGSNTLLSPGLEPGRLWFATQEDQINGIQIKIDGKDEIIGRHRVYMYLDDANHRYVVSGPVYWDDIINPPRYVAAFATQFNTTNNNTISTLIGRDQYGQDLTTITLPFVSKAGDTMTGPLTIAREAQVTGQPSPPKVTLDYNDITDSLDFTFT